MHGINLYSTRLEVFVGKTWSEFGLTPGIYLRRNSTGNVEKKTVQPNIRRPQRRSSQKALSALVELHKVLIHDISRRNETEVLLNDILVLGHIPHKYARFTPASIGACAAREIAKISCHQKFSTFILRFL